jgi:hypothetical protein
MQISSPVLIVKIKKESGFNFLPLFSFPAVLTISVQKGLHCLNGLTDTGARGVIGPISSRKGLKW